MCAIVRKCMCKRTYMCVFVACIYVNMHLYEYEVTVFLVVSEHKEMYAYYYLCVDMYMYVCMFAQDMYTCMF